LEQLAVTDKSIHPSMEVTSERSILTTYFHGKSVVEIG
jgi:hypothetical protein